MTFRYPNGAIVFPFVCWAIFLSLAPLMAASPAHEPEPAKPAAAAKPSASKPADGKSSGGEEDESTGDGEKSQRLREGTRIEDQLGTFKISGDRAVFCTMDNSHRFGVLENLNLARIMTAVADNEDVEWSVTGIATEFRGSNYLLISRATLKTKVAETGHKPSLEAAPTKTAPAHSTPASPKQPAKPDAHANEPSGS